MAVAFNLEDAYNSPVQTPAHTKWSLPNTDLVDCRSAHGKNNGYAAWKLELCSWELMPAVTFEGGVVEQTNHLRYHLINWQKAALQTRCENTALKCKKGLSVLKAMAAKSTEQRHLFLLCQSEVLSVTEYGLSLAAMAQTNLLKLDRVQNEAMRDILGTTKNTPTETMRFMLDLPPM